jgi:hypothetical protein
MVTRTSTSARGGTASRLPCFSARWPRIAAPSLRRPTASHRGSSASASDGRVLRPLRLAQRVRPRLLDHAPVRPPPRGAAARPGAPTTASTRAAAAWHTAFSTPAAGRLAPPVRTAAASRGPLTPPPRCSAAARCSSASSLGARLCGTRCRDVSLAFYNGRRQAPDGCGTRDSAARAGTRLPASGTRRVRRARLTCIRRAAPPRQPVARAAPLPFHDGRRRTFLSRRPMVPFPPQQHDAFFFGMASSATRTTTAASFTFSSTPSGTSPPTTAWRRVAPSHEWWRLPLPPWTGTRTSDGPGGVEPRPVVFIHYPHSNPHPSQMGRVWVENYYPLKKWVGWVWGGYK